MFKNSLNNIFKYFFLALFLGYFGSITFFNHAHIIDGSAIVHSHPYKSDNNGNPTHNHTQNGYLLIHLLKNFNAAITIIFVLNQFPDLSVRLKFETYDRFPSPVLVSSNPLRGPPAPYLILSF
jgi:hypothetical protein